MLRGGAFKPRTSPYSFQGLGREALEILSGGEHCRILLDVVPPYAEFLRAREREAEALELDARLAERVPTAA